jgi:hypothetical protein
VDSIFDISFSFFLQESSSQQHPGPAVGGHIGPPPDPREEPMPKPPKTWIIFSLPHLGQTGFRPFSFWATEAKISTFSLQLGHTYS